MPRTGCEHYGDCRRPLSQCKSDCTDYKKSVKKRMNVNPATAESIKKECARCHLFSGSDCMMPTPEFGCVRDLLARAEAAEAARDKADATWMLALKEIDALKTERDHFAEHSKDDDDCDKTRAECRKEAARRAVGGER